MDSQTKPQAARDGIPARTPYAFIPFNEGVIRRYGSKGEIPGHDRQDTGLLSGEIVVSVHTETPLMYGSADASGGFPKNSRGQYFLPGASLRGLIRENMQILGYGAARPGRDVDCKLKKSQKTYTLTDGLPRGYRMDILDYPDAILGYIGKTGGYRSRVSVGDLMVQGNTQPLPAVGLTLAAPKPSFCPAYFQSEKGEIRTYQHPNFRLSGYKQYWMKEVQAPPSDAPSEDTGGRTNPKIESGKLTSTAPVLPIGTELRGTIRYRNLYPDELGLLLGCLDLGLWQIHPEKECFQSLGKGKPYGYGRVTIRIHSLKEHDMTALYHGFSSPQQAADAAPERMRQLVEAYLTEAGARLGERWGNVVDLRRQSRILDFFFMKQAVRKDSQEVSYMKLNEFSDVTMPLPTVAQVRKRTQQPK